MLENGGKQQRERLIFVQRSIDRLGLFILTKTDAGYSLPGVMADRFEKGGFPKNSVNLTSVLFHILRKRLRPAERGD
ncbi:hypothetical protein D1872_288360 [compost metagenome]